ncbi:hypothetical protein OIU79_019858 [Salix purpurea]|uniref:Uncharacterized protein n=1 Tax=Salix purpurea TaxID=77065 RepID=A0A9Q0P285_SALPP|nr:hypothetical protein OIU79_019858 [Salix purpurea]
MIIIQEFDVPRSRLAAALNLFEKGTGNKSAIIESMKFMMHSSLPPFFCHATLKDFSYPASPSSLLQESILISY